MVSGFLTCCEILFHTRNLSTSYSIVDWMRYLKLKQFFFKNILFTIHDHLQCTFLQESWYVKTLVLKWKHIISVIVEKKLIKLNHRASFTYNKSWINYKHDVEFSTTNIQYCNHVLKLYWYKKFHIIYM